MANTKNYTECSWKGRFINDLIHDLNYQKYLELGVATGETWNQINCDYKVGVDVANDFRWHVPRIISVTTDNYFRNLDKNETFDLIYIDACHEKTQVKADFYNSFRHLNENGIILLHDVNPPSKDGTSQNAHGDCFELWIKMVNMYPKNVAVFNAAPGTAMFNMVDTVGIFFKTNINAHESDIHLQVGTFNDYSYEFFIANHEIYNRKIEKSYDSIVESISKK